MISLSSLIKKIKFEHCVIGSLLSFLPFHMLEEGCLGFPAWAEHYWHIPEYSVEKWFIHNLLFIGVLGIGLAVYFINRKKFFSAGLGIILWGFMNMLNHIVCSIIFGAIEPGITTSFLFGVFAALGVYSARKEGLLTAGQVGLTFIWSLLYWGLPIALFILVPGLG